MKLPLALHDASLKGCQGVGARMPDSFKNSWPGFSFHLLFERRKTEGERGKKRAGLLGKTMTLKKLKPVLKAAD